MLAGTDRLAGSALRMDRGIDNLMRLANLSLRDAVRLATTNAAKAGAVPGRKRGLARRPRRFRSIPAESGVEVIATYISGRKVFPPKNAVRLPAALIGAPPGEGLSWIRDRLRPARRSPLL